LIKKKKTKKKIYKMIGLLLTKRIN